MTRDRGRAGGGLSIAGRFSLFMTIALGVVMLGAAFVLLDKSKNALDQATRNYINEVARLTLEEQKANTDEFAAILRDYARRAITTSDQGLPDTSEDVKRLVEAKQATYRDLEKGFQDANGRVWRARVEFTEGSAAGQEGFLIQYDGGANLLAPADTRGGQGGSLFGLVLVVTAAVIAVGAGVAYFVSKQVSKPIDLLVDDVRAISRGNLRHRTRVKGGGEVYHLARQIDRMAQALDEAQEAEIQLGVREREREVAKEVREALLPERKPAVDGYEVGDLHVDAAEPGGDFHDFVESDGKLAMLVCGVSGSGIPGALVGATARAYLKGELERGGDLEEALKKINRNVAGDVRRGMYVTALCVVLDPEHHVATVACAGHKLPLIRYDAESKQLRLIQPEGIALGFDKGPVFDRGLELVRVSVQPGDRLVLANTGPVQVVNADGAELGEKAFYRLVAKYVSQRPDVMAKGILGALQKYAGEEGFPADISLVILARDG